MQQSDKPNEQQQNDVPDLQVQQRKPKKFNTLIAMGYNGTDYNGSQLQNGATNSRTIEGELMKALDVLGLLEGRDVSKLGLSRVSRTDSRVSAACTIVSFFVGEQDTLVSRLNSVLPPEIRVFGCMRVTPRFDGRSYCTSRKYEYFVPKIWLNRSKLFDNERANYNKLVTELNAMNSPSDHVRNFVRWELEQELQAHLGEMETVNKCLNIFCEHVHYYHNFATGADKMSETKRKMMRFELTNFDENYYLLKVEGQGFLYNQIRKMVGAAVVLSRGQAPLSWFTRALTGREEFKSEVITMPGEFLLLDRQEFRGYENHSDYKLYGELIQDRAEVVKLAEEFKKSVIYPQIVSTNPKIAAEFLHRLNNLHASIEIQLETRSYMSEPVKSYFDQGLEAIKREIEINKVLEERRVAVQMSVPSDKARPSEIARADKQ